MTTETFWWFWPLLVKLRLLCQVTLILWWYISKIYLLKTRLYSSSQIGHAASSQLSMHETRLTWTNKNARDRERQCTSVPTVFLCLTYPWLIEPQSRHPFNRFTVNFVSYIFYNVLFSRLQLALLHKLLQRRLHKNNSLVLSNIGFCLPRLE